MFSINPTPSAAELSFLNNILDITKKAQIKMMKSLVKNDFKGAVMSQVSIMPKMLWLSVAPISFKMSAKMLLSKEYCKTVIDMSVTAGFDAFTEAAKSNDDSERFEVAMNHHIRTFNEDAQNKNKPNLRIARHEGDILVVRDNGKIVKRYLAVLNKDTDPDSPCILFHEMPILPEFIMEKEIITEDSIYNKIFSACLRNEGPSSKNPLSGLMIGLWLHSLLTEEEMAFLEELEKEQGFQAVNKCFVNAMTASGKFKSDDGETVSPV